jgi:phospholipase/carboxylesterase
MSMSDQVGEGVVREHLEFVYRVRTPSERPASTLILLHGSGVDETTMMPLGREIAPEATLIAVRARVVQDGSRRWFTRITPTRFHQKSIRTEAAAFARFIKRLADAEAFDPARAVFIGYSNGANLISSTALLRSGLIRRAVLLRAMSVLIHTPDADLADLAVLIIAGARDETYGRFAPALASLLHERGARVETSTVLSGHEIGRQDVDRIRTWLASQTSAEIR